MTDPALESLDGLRARIDELEKRLSDALGLTVAIDHRSKGGELRIRYRSLEQLDEVIRRLERAA